MDRIWIQGFQLCWNAFGAWALPKSGCVRIDSNEGNPYSKRDVFVSIEQSQQH